ncbi:hypothetical protein D6C83_04483, partial [Aureobasidium pullulans]
MGVSNKVTDDNEGNVMDIALGSLRARKIPLLKVEGLSWILDQNLRPAIVVGYGTNDPEKMSSIHHIIKFHFRKRPIFNVVSAMEDYAVKHTRVATPNVVIFDEKIPAADITSARHYLQGQYIDFVLDVATAFRSRGLEVPLIDGFEEDVGDKGKGKGKGKTKIAAKPKVKVAKTKIGKKAKVHKRVSFLIEDDEDDGPIRRLTPIRSQPVFQGKSQAGGPSADESGQSSSERADSVMGEFSSRVSSPITLKSTFKTSAGLTQVIDPDTPMHSVEGYGLQTPTSSIDGKSGDIDMLSEDPWSLNGCGSTMAPPKHPGTYTAHEVLTETDPIYTYTSEVEPYNANTDSNMERVRQLWQQEQDYEPIEGGSVEEEQQRQELRESSSFSWAEYSIFLLLGVAMLWAWNMLLAAGPYFQSRFASSDRLLDNFQASELAVSSITNLGSMLVLTNMQARASYPRRIVMSLLINLVAFALLALSTWFALGVSANAYFAFLIFIVFVTSLAAGLCQNGVFAFVSGFGQPRYTQAIMTGQGVAGVLPCIAQILSVLSVAKSPSDEKSPDGSDTSPAVPGTAAFAYFLTATVICASTLLAFFFLVRQHNTKKAVTAHEDLASSVDSIEQRNRKSVPLAVLFRKLRWLAAAVFLTFTVTMMFPIYTQRILSVRQSDTSSRLFQAPSFIPLAFLFWNAGDLLGRLLPAVPSLSLIHRPKLIFVLSIARVGFIPLYHLCNIRGQGAVVKSDLFYLAVVQLLFGITNGYLGSIT